MILKKSNHFSPSFHVNLCWSSRCRWVFCTRSDLFLSYVLEDDPLCFGLGLINYGRLFYFGSVYFATKMAAAEGLVETK